MFLATTALDEFWDKKQEILFLGQWCRLYGRRKDWESLRGRMLASPWDEPGTVDRGSEGIAALQEALLQFLTAFLNEAHGVLHDERYWRIVIGPWLTGYAAVIVDHGMHLDRAFAEEQGLETWTLDPKDRRTPLDTADFASKLNDDAYQLQLYSEILESRGETGRSLRFPTSATTPPLPARWKTAVRAGLSRVVRAVIGPERIFSDFYASPRQTLALMRAASLAPMGDSIISPRAQIDAARRARLAEFQASAPFAAEAAALLPKHLPVLFLEGHADFRRAVLARWPRLPRRLLTSVGWYSNETFKLLAAEAVERGGELIVSQHGGAYGMMDPIFSEKHERRVSDRYFTWGWSDRHYPGGKTVPLPNPKMLAEPSRPPRPTGNWLLLTSTLPRYPYSCYFANAPASHRCVDQLEDRARFVRGLDEGSRAGLRVRLHPADLGWSHRARLADEFPRLAFDQDPKPWTSRCDQFDLIAIDHPQTSMLESLAHDKPALLFWNPALWRMRPEALPVLDGLRRAGILMDSPEAAARKIPVILADPVSWWMRPESRAARAAFCERYARSSPDWVAAWADALNNGPVNP